MPSSLLDSSREKETAAELDPNSIDSENSDAHSVKLAFPGCPSSFTEICVCFEETCEHDCDRCKLSCVKSKSDCDACEPEHENSKSDGCNFYSPEEESNKENLPPEDVISSEGNKSNNDGLFNDEYSDVSDDQEVSLSNVQTKDKTQNKSKNLFDRLPVYAQCSLQDHESRTLIEEEQQVTTCVRKSYNKSTPSSSANALPHRKRSSERAYEGKASLCPSLRSKSAGRAHKYKAEVRYVDELESTHVTASVSTAHLEGDYLSPPRDTLWGESSHGDTRAIQNCHKNRGNKKPRQKEKVLEKDKLNINVANIEHTDIEALISLIPEPILEFSGVSPNAQVSGNVHRSPPHVRVRSKSNRTIDRMFVDVMKMLVSLKQHQMVPSVRPEDKGFSSSNCPTDINQTANHEQQEACFVTQTTQTNSSCGLSSSCSHNTSEEILCGSSSMDEATSEKLGSSSSSKLVVSSPDLSELDVKYNSKYDDDEFTCSCCIMKSEQYNLDSNNCRDFFNDDQEEYTGTWTFVDDGSSSGGSSRESFGSYEDRSSQLESRSDFPSSHVESRSCFQAGGIKDPSLSDKIKFWQGQVPSSTKPGTSTEQNNDRSLHRQHSDSDLNPRRTKAKFAHLTSNSHQNDLLKNRSKRFGNVVCDADIASSSSEFSVIRGRRNFSTTVGRLHNSVHEKDSPDTNAGRNVDYPQNEMCCACESSSCSHPDKQHESDPSISFQNSLETNKHGVMIDNGLNISVGISSYSSIPLDCSHLVLAGTSKQDGEVSVHETKSVRTVKDSCESSFIQPRVLSLASTSLSPSDNSANIKETDNNTDNIRKDNENERKTTMSTKIYENFEYSKPIFSSDTFGQAAIPTPSTTGSPLFVATSCLGKAKAALSRVRSRSLSPFVSKLSSMFDRVKRTQASAARACSLSGMFKDRPCETQLSRATKSYLLDTTCSGTNNLDEEARIFSEDGRITRESDAQHDVHDILNTASTTSGDDHPPIFCLEVNQTESIRKNMKQLSRKQDRTSSSFSSRESTYQQLCSLTHERILENTQSSSIPEQTANGSIGLDNEQNSDRKVQTFVNSTNKYLEMFKHSKPQNCEIGLREGTPGSRKEDHNMANSTTTKLRSPFLVSIKETDSISNDLSADETDLERNDVEEGLLDAMVESYCAKESFGMVVPEVGSDKHHERSPNLQTISSFINYKRDSEDASIYDISLSVPMKSCSSVSAKEATHAEAGVIEVMAIISDEVNIKRYPSFPDLTDLNHEDVSILSTKASGVVFHGDLDQNMDKEPSIHGVSVENHLKPLAMAIYGDLETGRIYKNVSHCEPESSADTIIWRSESPPRVMAAEECDQLLSPHMTQDEEQESEIQLITLTSVPETNSTCASSTNSDTLCTRAGSMDSEKAAERNFSHKSMSSTILLENCESCSPHKMRTDFSSCTSLMDIKLTASDFNDCTLPSPPDHSLSESSWENGACCSHTNPPRVGAKPLTLPKTNVQSTSELKKTSELAAPVSKLNLLRAAVTQNCSAFIHEASSGQVSAVTTPDISSMEE